MIATRLTALTALAASALLLAGCGQAIAPTAAAKGAAGLAARAADATPREVAKLLDRDGDGFVTELEGWIDGRAENETFRNHQLGEAPGRPVPTSLVERALATNGEVGLRSVAGGGTDGQPLGLAAATRVAQGLARILQADATVASGRIPARFTLVRDLGLRSDVDEVRSYASNVLAGELQRLLTKPGPDARVKLLSGETLQGRRYRLALNDTSLF